MRELKTFNVSLDDLDTLLARLWEECQDHGCYFSPKPLKNRIEVYKQDDEHSSYPVAEITVVNISDTYDICKTLFEEKL